MVARFLFVLAGLVAQAATGGAVLPVPFLPQTEALCGGAAAAMVYRYWGDHHADVQQFAPLVDREAGGIRDSVLVSAIRDKGWRVTQSVGSIAALQQSLAARQPAIVLIEDRPNRYHFIVAVGIDDDAVVVHDPTWGPFRRIPIATFVAAWTPARFWMLVVLPSDTQPSPTPETGLTDAAVDAPVTECDRRLDAALDEIEARGLTAADAALGRVRTACPDSAAPLRELAGVRAAQSRWPDAIALSRHAVRLDPTDRYAWNVLGSGLFVHGRSAEALAAWNHAGTPQLDSFELRGVTRTRHALIAGVTGLTPNTLLTPRAYGLAERRIEQLPDRVSSGLSLTPGTDGFATVTATIRETSRMPRGNVEWVAAGLQTAINREITASVAGWSGQGEMWTGSWRWWEHRPRVAGSFSAPRAGRLGGVWRIDAAWEAQTYAVGGALGWQREDRRTGLLSLRNWITRGTRYELRGGLDAWDRNRRAVVAGATLEQRLLADRVAIMGSFDRWSAIGGDPHFFSGSATAAFRSSREPRGVVMSAFARVDAASAAAPLALWSGAGEGRGRPGLIRAHLLLYDGVIDGAIFGRRSGVTNLEVQRWFATGVAAVAIAGFADIAEARHRLPQAPGRAWQADTGFGFRARVPGQPGTLRVDYAYGVVDGAQRISAGWNVLN